MSSEQSADIASHPMAFLLEGDFGLHVPKTGDICTGHIVSISGSHILVDIGAKSEGYIDPREVEQLPPEERDELEIGGEVTVMITNAEDSRGNISLSITQAIMANEWSNAKALLESAEEVEVQILGKNRGGLLTQVGRLRGFVPASQLGLTQQEYRDDFIMSQFQGKTLKAKVIEVDPDRNRLILSAKEAADKAKKSKRLEKIAHIDEGAVLNGKIVNMERFGIFVDVGGIQGLVHLSELSWSRITSPEELYSIGEEVEVIVLNIDEEKARIALSIKRLKDDPWKVADGVFTEGTLAKARITKIEKYGAFAELQHDVSLEGLIHLSEFKGGKIKHPSHAVAEGEIVTVEIIKIDIDKRQLGLSLNISQELEEEFEPSLSENES